MGASVDEAALVVRSGNSAWPFSVDRGGISATMTLDGVAYRVRPQSWREKVRLARFARLGASFAESSFLECCVEDGPARAVTEHKEALLALALWINLPDDDTAVLPLDADQLARVTIEVCRAMNIGPLAIADLSAPEVESLWRNLDRGASRGEADNGQPAEERFDTRIVVLPDAARPDGAAQAVARSGTTLAPRYEMNASPTEAKRADPVEPDAHTAPPAVYKEEPVMAAPSQAPNAAEPARSEGRFRVSFTTAAVKERRVSPLTASSKPSADFRAAKPSPLNAERESPKAGLRRDGELSGHASAVPEWEALLPAAATEAALPTATALQTAMPRAGAPDIAPSFEFARRPAPMESLLDEFCERLDEAAADLGILEEV